MASAKRTTARGRRPANAPSGVRRPGQAPAGVRRPIDIPANVRRPIDIPANVRHPKDIIIDRLIESGDRGRTLSGASLAEELGMSRAAVGKHIRDLREEGYDIASSPGKGFSLNGVPDIPYPRELMRGLPRGRAIPTLVYYHDTLASTNAEAKRLAEAGAGEGAGPAGAAGRAGTASTGAGTPGTGSAPSGAVGAPDGCVVIADTQKAGRGRLDRSWSSPRGGIWMSVVLRPPVPPAGVNKLVLLTGNAVCAALKYAVNIDAGLKWPNDVLVDGRKMCGILAEASMEMDRVHYVVMGVGLNFDFPLSKLPKPLGETATTARALVDRPLRRVPMVRAVLKEMAVRYADFCGRGGRASGGRAMGEGTDPIIEEWRERAVTLGRKVRVETPSGAVEGTAVDIDDGGRLLVRTKEGQIEVSAGDCEHLR